MLNGEVAFVGIKTRFGTIVNRQLSQISFSVGRVENNRPAELTRPMLYEVADTPVMYKTDRTRHIADMEKPVVRHLLRSLGSCRVLVHCCSSADVRAFRRALARHGAKVSDMGMTSFNFYLIEGEIFDAAAMSEVFFKYIAKRNAVSWERLGSRMREDRRRIDDYGYFEHRASGPIGMYDRYAGVPMKDIPDEYYRMLAERHRDDTEFVEMCELAREGIMPRKET
ncbi:MAG: hypothetical protein WC145_07915 [Aliarcobacter sp.]|jgi:hypothetical protein